MYLAVAAGLYAAGGGVQGTFDQAPSDIRAKLRVLWSSQPHAPHAFAAHPRVSPAQLARVSAAMLAADDDEAGRGLLANVGFKQGISAAQDADWNAIRALPLARIAPKLRD